MTAPLLVELLTEELPPKALTRLMEAFSRNLFDGLKEKNFLEAGAAAKPFATPRRLAVVISQVLEKQADRKVERKGPALASALDAAGRPTPALIGFAKSCGVDMAQLEKRTGDKGEYFVYCSKQKGEALKQHLATIVEAALKKLPIPKLMRWGDGEAQFVRPVHGVILLHGNKIVSGTVLGLKSGNKTLGHRFLSKGPITIRRVNDYEKILKQSGKVIASFGARREVIAKGLDTAAKKIASGTSWSLGKTDDLVEEVTGLVEYPVVLTGSFDMAFLEVPKECLIISMQQHQKYFPLVDKEGKLLPRFLFVSNMKVANPKEIIHGNERVLRARLSDAQFFYDQDRKQRLPDRLPRLGNVVYHNKLGSQLERVQRLEKLSGKIAQLLKADRAHAERAAQLSKADLLTEMVGEFPELQGIMGHYYAKYDHEPTVVADAIEQHYWPRTAGGELPRQPVAVCVALADKLDTLVGIYGIGLVPTGEKDPFGLRRAALGVVRILIEKTLPLDIMELLQLAHTQFPNGVVVDTVVLDLYRFILERLKPYFREKGFESYVIDAVISQNSKRFDKLPNLLTHVRAYFTRPEAKDLAEINKRVLNIIKKNREEIGWDFSSTPIEQSLLKEQAEINLYSAIKSVSPVLELAFKKEEYGVYFDTLVTLKPVLSNFFDKGTGVLVMHPEKEIRINRAKILQELGHLMNRVADISRLQS